MFFLAATLVGWIEGDFCFFLHFITIYCIFVVFSLVDVALCYAKQTAECAKNHRLFWSVIAFLIFLKNRTFLKLDITQILSKSLKTTNSIIYLNELPRAGFGV